MSETTSSSMNGVKMLNRGVKIRRPKKKANLLNDKQLRDTIQRFTSSGCTAKDFLVSGSHCCESATRPLQTDEYEIDPAEFAVSDDTTANPAVPTNAVAAVSVPESCDVCLVATRDKIALVPCRQAKLCRACIDTLVAVNGHCPLCTSDILTTVQLLTEFSAVA